MKELDLGSKLYYIDKKTEESRDVEVVYVYNSGFGFYLDGTPPKLPYTVILGFAFRGRMRGTHGGMQRNAKCQ